MCGEGRPVQSRSGGSRDPNYQTTSYAYYPLAQDLRLQEIHHKKPGLATDDVKTFEWDAENRLITVKQGGNTLASFSYDGKGRRATKTASGVTTSYVHDGGQFLEERPNPGTTRRYVYGPGIDQALAQAVGGTTTYNVADHLGSVVRTTETAGTPILTREYDPWGNPLQGSATSGYAFTGREWDAAITLYYYRARYYDSGVGRFISEDPFGWGAGSNFYAYVDNSPLTLIDPSGLLKTCCRPAQFFPGCHCWIVLSNDETLGAYRFGPLLQKIRDWDDDWPTPAGSTCYDLADCYERRVIDAYNGQPDRTMYRVPSNTSNTLISRALQVIPYRLPLCAVGADAGSPSPQPAPPPPPPPS